MEQLVSTFTKMRAPNIMAKWLALLLCILEVLDSNLGLEASYPD
jgi:hypothetical protein